MIILGLVVGVYIPLLATASSPPLRGLGTRLSVSQLHFRGDIIHR